MLDSLQSHLQLPTDTLALAAVVVLVAGMVRGFSGFGLSALIMASLALLIPPIALIPVCFLLEAVASIVMLRGGLANGNRKLVRGLVVGYFVGVPLGLSATIMLPMETSRLLALALILTLALLQLVKATPEFLRWPNAVFAAGLLAGTGTGLASVGGMVVALYVLSLQVQPREIRGSLVLFLLFSMVITGFWLIITGTLDQLAFKRAVLLVPFAITGVLMGTWLFRPSLEPIYKRFCLFLLMSLATVGLVRLMLL